MHLLFLIYAFIFGAIIGSFLNVVSFRYTEGKSVGGRSHCPHCKKILSPLELIPIVSYLFQRGKCRHCDHTISIQYPLVEFGMGVLTTIAVWYGLSFAIPLQGILLLIILMAFMLLIVVYDFRYTIIPNLFVYSFAYFALLYNLLPCISSYDPLLCLSSTSLFAGPFLFFILFLIWDLSGERAIGLGDAKFALGMGWLLGFEQGLSAVILSFWIGAVIGVLLLIAPIVSKSIGPLFALWRREKTATPRFSMKSEIPFAPFLVLGTILTLCINFNLFDFFV